MRKILVTGGCGFVGRHVCNRFIKLGDHVDCVDNLVSESALNPTDWPAHLRVRNREFDFFQEDARAYFGRVSASHYDIVVHLAAIVGGRVMIEQSPLAVATDLSIDAEMFNWASKERPGKLVFFSSSAAYPIRHQTVDAKHVRLSEDMINFNSDIGVADMTYGWSKLTGEFLALMAHDKYDIDVTCFRPFSGYGEDQHTSYPFPAILSRAKKRDNPIDVWSNAVRDFVYIDDCVDGMLTIMENVHDGRGINLGTGVATSFSQLATMMGSACGGSTNVNVLNDKPTGVHYRVADTQIAESLGFVATTTLEEGIKRCIELS